MISAFPLDFIPCYSTQNHKTLHLKRTSEDNNDNSEMVSP